ncbi:tumor necrosis factor receptor superfamily member 4 isoform X3 [Myotis myotis]|uniref:tumor necrosis factor receptor superfamily member 4 isoform X3 n=1 Tax=Myotis myotis TaxID=51298 RepID=UPI001748F75E|nr:tumor necrosis factor receptor superfamily member 4 isoform X3 [Myotis myotis]
MREKHRSAASCTRPTGDEPATEAALAAGSELGGPNQNAAGSPSSDLCEAGHYVSADCTMGQAVRCCPCPPDSFLAHPSRAQSCSPCTQCREDQEMVSDCTPKRDRKCQCKTEEFYCDSEHCLEGCHPCTRCPGATLRTCNATRDTECAPAAQPEPGPPAGSLAVSALAVSVVSIVIVVIAIGIAIAWWRRRGMLLPQWLCRFRTATSGELGSHAILRPTDPERGPLAPSADMTPLLQEEADALTPSALTSPGPSGDPDPDPDPGAGAELQVEVTGGGGVAPEPAPPTPAAAASAGPGPG